MREKFPGFYRRTEEEFSLFREKATFVLDTNMLLNIYRYQEETGTRFFEILEKLRERGRLWIPHQVIYEYLDNRVKVINDQVEVYSDVSKAINKARESLKSLEHLKKKHSFINIEEIITPSVDALTQANKTLSDNRNTSKNKFTKLLKDPTSDIYIEKFTKLFQGIAGKAYKKGQLISLYSQADKRFELQIPPGLKDKTKKNYGKYGDVIIWFQLLDYASLHKNKPIIFVTDDKKSDWYLSIEDARTSVLGQKDNNYPAPRPELIQEMFVETGALFHIYDGDEFFEQATVALELTPEPKISADVKSVTEQNTIEREISEVFVSDSVSEFIGSLPDAHERRRILHAMHRMKSFRGNDRLLVFRNPLYDGKLWESTVYGRYDNYGLIYVVKPNGDIVVIHGFKNRTAAEMQKEIEIAQQQYEHYLNEDLLEDTSAL